MKLRFALALLVGLLLTATPVSARKWTSSDGQFSVEAELVEAKDGNVRLKRQDGKVITVPVSKLSKADRGYLASIAKPEKKPQKDDIAKAEDFSRLQERGGLGYLPNATEPYTGWIKKLYDDSEQVEFLLKLDEGKPAEFRHWHANGNLLLVCGLSDKADTALASIIEALEKNRKPHERYLHGKVVGWHENGQKGAEGTYKDGKSDGPVINWHENGQKAREGTYKDGERDGLFTRWYENGQKKREVSYKDGKEDGPYIKYNEDGTEENRSTFKDGEQVDGKPVE